MKKVFVANEQSPYPKDWKKENTVLLIAESEEQARQLINDDNAVIREVSLSMSQVLCYIKEEPDVKKSLAKPKQKTKIRESYE